MLGILFFIYPSRCFDGYNATVLAYGQVCHAPQCLCTTVLVNEGREPFVDAKSTHVVYLHVSCVNSSLQTGSGKTYTMGTGFGVELLPEMQGKACILHIVHVL